MAPRPVKLVTAHHIRRLFHQANCPARLAAGDLTAVVKKSKHPAAPRAQMPVCTRSQILAYVDHHQEAVALVHQYLKPDGTLGASGQADPKWLLFEGTVYQVI
jgi:hypothetical protein